MTISRLSASLVNLTAANVRSHFITSRGTSRIVQAQVRISTLFQLEGSKIELIASSFNPFWMVGHSASGGMSQANHSENRATFLNGFQLGLVLASLNSFLVTPKSAIAFQPNTLPRKSTMATLTLTDTDLQQIAEDKLYNFTFFALQSDKDPANPAQSIDADAFEMKWKINNPTLLGGLATLDRQKVLKLNIQTLDINWKVDAVPNLSEAELIQRKDRGIVKVTDTSYIYDCLCVEKDPDSATQTIDLAALNDRWGITQAALINAITTYSRETPTQPPIFTADLSSLNVIWLKYAVADSGDGTNPYLNLTVSQTKPFTGQPTSAIAQSDRIDGFDAASTMVYGSLKDSIISNIVGTSGGAVQITLANGVQYSFNQLYQRTWADIQSEAMG